MIRETDLPLRILRLEQKLESYQKLHAEELDEIRLALAELKRQVLDTAIPAARGCSDPPPEALQR